MFLESMIEYLSNLRLDIILGFASVFHNMNMNRLMVI